MAIMDTRAMKICFSSLLIVFVLYGWGFAQPLPPPSALDLGMRLPENAAIRPGRGETLLLPLSASDPHVVRLHCAIGDRNLVMLPSGELVMAKPGATQPTDKPFAAASLEQMQQALKDAKLSSFKVVEAKPYLFVYDCSEAFYLHTRSILESMLPGVVASLRGWGQTVSAPPVPLVVVIMPNRAAFSAYDRVPESMLAYYNTLTNFVVLYEDQRLWEAAPEYAAKQAAYTVAHESIHQLLHNTGVQQRLSNWPMWVSEGLPEYYCPLKINSKLVQKGNAELPTRTIRWTRPGMVNDLRMYDLLRIDAKSGDVVKKLVQSDRLDGEGYALAWGLVHYLANEEPKKFQAYLKELNQFEPLDPAHRKLAGRADPLFVKYFGDDFAAIEQSIQKHLTSKAIQAEYVDPIDNQTHYVVKRSQKQGKAFAISLIITTSPAAAKKWKEEQEAENKSGKFFTKICKSRQEAENEIARLQQR
jgi:Protein of unknown function (DUF1570)